ncbi:MAG: SUMF1/EgtB/PvdO family nonheme iron enzyme [Clostridia bacterium]|nr:SUMF1/EgtB/PvdO family nonheme iron enzyme [Clostridia bacterium]
MNTYFNKIRNYYAAEINVQNFFWNNVCDMAEALGYDLMKRGTDKYLPAVHITFYEAVKMCNALNEICGLKPVYYSKGNAVRKGCFDDVEIKGRGIRLPTEKEWEFAADGGAETEYFWGNDAGNNKTNQYAWMYDLSEKDAFVIHRPKEKKPNMFGLYDITGNVYEWCFDKVGEYRIIKGGSVALDSVLKTKFTSFVPDRCESIDVGLRLFSDFQIDIPDDLFIEKETNVRFVPRKYDFFELLDPQCDEIKEVIDLHNKGLDKEAKTAYVKILKHKAESKNFDYGFNLRYAMENLDMLMKQSGEIHWYGENHHGAFAQGFYLKALTEQYRISKDKKCLNQIIYFTCQNETRKEAFENLDMKKINDNDGFIPNSWDFTQGFKGDVKLYCGIGLTMLLKFIDEKDLYDELCDAVIKMAMYIIVEDIPYIIKDARTIVPNQSIDNACCLIMAGNTLIGFKEAPGMLKLGYERYEDAVLNKCVFPDGSDMEQSYNYNYALCSVFHELKEYFGYVPKELEKIQVAVVNRARFLKAISQPFGGQPASGTSSGLYPPETNGDVEALEKIRDTYNTNKIDKYMDRAETIDCTSITIPYSGTSILKNNNKADGIYLWHFGARPGTGHAVENVNSIQLLAYGMPMLVTGGASCYRSKSSVPEEQWDMIKDFDLYQRSSFAANTAVIDGMGQGRLRNNENTGIGVYKDCCGYRFYTDENFDFSETCYDGEYCTENKILNAEHMREVIFAKKYNLFIVKDIIKADGEHKFGLVYNIMPDKAQTRDLSDWHEKEYYACGYGKDEVEHSGNRIFTTKKDDPNFEIYSVGQNTRIELHYGERNPLLGWFGGSIRSIRKEKYDAHITWTDKDITVHYSIIGVSPNENRIIQNIRKDGESIVIDTVSGTVMLDGERISDKEGNCLYFKDIKKVTGFEWIKTGDKVAPKYTFE